MNCSRCKTGVLESIGYLEIKPGPLELVIISFITPKDSAAIGIRVCSNDYCGHTEMNAEPGSLTLIKRKLRESKYSEENLNVVY